MTLPVIIDIEASGFGRGSYPIEIGSGSLAQPATWAGLPRAAAALIVSNTTITRPHLKSPQAGEAGGLSGAPLRDLAQARLADFRRATGGEIPLIGVGGIAIAADAWARIRAGASLIQLYSAMVYEGPGLARKITCGLEELMQKASITLASVGDIVHGTTLVTNAIIERKGGARLGLLTTAGFRDILEMGTEQRYDIYDLFLQFPEPFVPRSRRVGVPERMDRDGNVVVAYPKQLVKDAPRADADGALSEDEERDLYTHYGRPYMTADISDAMPSTSTAPTREVRADDR